MNISVFGMGYVGVVTGACLAELGHTVVGVDVDDFKVDSVNRGESPIVEDLIGDLIKQGVDSGKFRATTSVEEAIANSDLSIVCVGTPSNAHGALETTYVSRVSAQIGEEIKKKDTYHTVVIRSTVLPGTVETVVRPAVEEHSGKKAGDGFGLCFHPEFLREGTSVKDFREPPKIVIGADDSRAADALAQLYDSFDVPVTRTSIGAAEMVKYADNCFHALKVVFGNEIGLISKQLGIDSHEVMTIFCQDRKLNISPAYLMPGFAYGGSCLPKDLRALMHLARETRVEAPVLANIQRSNDNHINHALDLVINAKGKKIAILGLSFKKGTDDLRESPIVELVERLIGKGYEVAIHDENVLISRLRGGNKAYIEQRLPHISQLLSDDAEAIVRDADIVVLGVAGEHIRPLLEQHGASKTVIDLVRLYDKDPGSFSGYEGICW